MWLAYYDNAKTFKSASKEIRNIVGSKEISSYLTSFHVTYSRASSLVGSGWCNLTYMHDDVEGVSYSISPSQLLYGQTITNWPNGETFEVSSTYDSLVRRSKQQRRTLSQFLSIWRKMYLTNLREYHHVKGQLTRKGPRISVGDVVILKNDSTKRLYWKLAIVHELLTENDGRVRAAMVKVTDDQNKTRSLRRNTQHLIPIEVKDKERSLQPVEEVEESPPSCSTSADNDAASTEEVVNTGRPRRQAAVVGELNCRINKTY